MLGTFWSDLESVLRNDPAAKGYLEAALCHAPLHAIWSYRVSHFLYRRLRLRLLGRFVSVLARFWSGVEIHPAAKIGSAFFIDHGAGVVIGETAEIGHNCVLFHNVTLGGTGKYAGKRHPTIGDHVIIGTGATLLGPMTVGNRSKIGANTFIIMRDVPPDCTVIGTPGRIVKLDGSRVDLALRPTVVSNDSIPVGASVELRAP